MKTINLFLKKEKVVGSQGGGGNRWRVWRQGGAAGIRVRDGGHSTDRRMPPILQAHMTWWVMADVRKGCLAEVKFHWHFEAGQGSIGIISTPSLPWSGPLSALASAIPRASSQGPSPLPTQPIPFTYCSHCDISKIQIRSQHSPTENL